MLLLAWPLYCIIHKYVAKYTDFIALYKSLIDFAKFFFINYKTAFAVFQRLK